MKKKLLNRFIELNDLYSEKKSYIEIQIKNQQKAASCKTTNNECCSTKKSCSADQNLQLKDTLEALFAQIKLELEKNDADINYQAYNLKIEQAEELFKELDYNVQPTWKKIRDSLLFQVFVVIFLKTFVFGWYCVPTGSAEPTLLVGDRILANKTAYWFDTVKRGDCAVFDSPEVAYSNNLLMYLWQRFVGVKIKFLGLPAGPENFVKRVIAIPGDIIEGKIEDGKPVVYRNGEKLVEPYVNTLPLIAVQKMNGFFSPKNPVFKVLPRFLTWPFIKRKSENCGGQPSWYTYDPAVSYEDQPYYKLEAHEVLKNPITGKPFLRNAGEPDSYDVFPRMRVPEGKYWCQGDSRRNSRDCRSWGFLDGNLIRGKASVIVYSINSEEIWWLFDILANPIDFWTKKLRSERSFTMLKNPLPESQQR